VEAQTTGTHRYLVFDAGCSTCTQLAVSIQDAAGTKLEAISIRDAETKALLDQAFPEGWRHAPYFVVVDRGRVRASTGMSAALRMGWLMGPWKALRIWSLARRSGVAVPPRNVGSSAHQASRRGVLRFGIAALVAGALAHWRGQAEAPDAVASQPCDCGCYEDCYYTNACNFCFGEPSPCYAPSYYQCDFNWCPPCTPGYCDSTLAYIGDVLCH
jgi:predicted DCC family thiol-disulfide oxidoreductase YuxK